MERQLHNCGRSLNYPCSANVLWENGSGGGETVIVLKIPREHKALLVNKIQSYFVTERSEEIGELAAGNLLDFMVEQLGPIIYNQAIRDARTVVMQQMERVEEELHALEQPLELLKRN
jgi:uncharacterized protein (DUF2164 family)